MANDIDSPKFNVNKYVTPKTSSPYVDMSDAYANNIETVISFQYVPSGQTVYFKAFITSFNEAYNSQILSEQVFGRVDPIYSFQQVQRDLNFTFKVPAASKSEAYENLGNIQQLIQFLYPTYTDASVANSISASPLIRLKVMNLVQNNQVIITSEENSEEDPSSLDPSVIFEEYSSSPDASSGLLGTINNLSVNHMIAEDDGVIEKGENTILPKLIEITCNFSAIHEGKLGWDRDDDGTSPSNISFPYNVTLENSEPVESTNGATTTDADATTAEVGEDDASMLDTFSEINRRADKN
jgi:hypothetical protein